MTPRPLPSRWGLARASVVCHRADPRGAVTETGRDCPEFWGGLSLRVTAGPEPLQAGSREPGCGTTSEPPTVTADVARGCQALVRGPYPVNRVVLQLGSGRGPRPSPGGAGETECTALRPPQPGPGFRLPGGTHVPAVGTRLLCGGEPRPPRGAASLRGVHGRGAGIPSRVQTQVALCLGRHRVAGTRRAAGRVWGGPRAGVMSLSSQVLS